jgi:hypothetical protein
MNCRFQAVVGSKGSHALIYRFAGETAVPSEIALFAALGQAELQSWRNIRSP